MVTVSHLICPLVNSFLILDTSLWWSFLSLTCSPRTSNCFDFSRSLSFNWPWEMRRFSRMLLKSKDWHQLPLSMCVQQELFFSGKSKLLIFLAGCKDLGPVLNAIFVSSPFWFNHICLNYCRINAPGEKAVVFIYIECFLYLFILYKCTTLIFVKYVLSIYWYENKFF